VIGGVVSASPRNSASVILYFDGARILNYAELFTLGIRCPFRRNSILLIREIFASAVIILIDECKYRVTLQSQTSAFTIERTLRMDIITYTVYNTKINIYQ